MAFSSKIINDLLLYLLFMSQCGFKALQGRNLVVFHCQVLRMNYKVNSIFWYVVDPHRLTVGCHCFVWTLRVGGKGTNKNPNRQAIRIIFFRMYEIMSTTPRTDERKVLYIVPLFSQQFSTSFVCAICVEASADSCGHPKCLPLWCNLHRSLHNKWPSNISRCKNGGRFATFLKLKAQVHRFQETAVCYATFPQICLLNFG